MTKPLVIRPMLAAQRWDRDITQKHLDTDGFLYMQPKIDGFRYLFHNGEARSRSWKLWKHRYVQMFAKDHADLIQGWDCEGTAGHKYDPNGFREAMSSLRSEDGTSRFTLWLFDNFDPSWAHYTYEHRRCSNIADLIAAGDPAGEFTVDPLAHLNTWNTPTKWFEELAPLGTTYMYQVQVKLCPTFVVTSLKEIDELYQEMLDRGWEGSILRRKGRPYKYNRSTMLEGGLVKLKPEETFEVVIEGVYPRRRNDNEPTRNALGYTVRSAHSGNKTDLECVGGFSCHMLGDPTKKVDVGVLRMDYSTKEELWRVRDTLPGKILECCAHGYSGGYDAPRTAVGIRLRDPTEL